ncbi:MAG: hypothetical protein GY928_33625 [Colwellia sp.]|nr:hypothetical protein [Colwellia sp.]
MEVETTKVHGTGNGITVLTIAQNVLDSDEPHQLCKAEAKKVFELLKENLPFETMLALFPYFQHWQDTCLEDSLCFPPPRPLTRDETIKYEQIEGENWSSLGFYDV